MMAMMDFSVLFPQKGQNVVFDFITLAFIIIILIAIGINVWKGLLSSLISFCSGIGSLLLSYLISKPVSSLLASNKSISAPFYNPINNWMLGFKDGALHVEVPAENKEILVESLKSETNLPSFIFKNIEDIILKDSSNGKFINELLSYELTKILFLVMTFIALFIVFKIIFFIIGILVKKVNDLPVIGPINRILGGVLGLFDGFLICMVVCSVFYLIFLLNIGNDGFTSIIANDWFNGLWNSSNWSFSQGLYQLFIQLL